MPNGDLPNIEMVVSSGECKATETTALLAAQATPTPPRLCLASLRRDREGGADVAVPATRLGYPHDSGSGQ